MQVVDALTVGGAERVAVMLANALAERSAGSQLVTTRADGPLVATVAAGVDHLCLERTGRLGVRAARHLRRLVAEQGVDVVHVHGSSVYFVGLALLGPAPPAIVWHDHNSRLWERTPWIVRLGAALADTTIVVSDELGDWHRAIGVPGERVVLLPNPVDVSEAVPGWSDDLPGPKAKRVVLVGNLRPEKNHVGAIRAFARVVAAHPAATLLCVGGLGDAPVVAEVRATIAEHGLGDRVHLLGTRTDVAAVLGASAIGLQFSHAEGSSIALLEYGLAGLPSVASDVGGARGLAEGTDGLRVVAVGDETGLADEVVALLADPVAAARAGEHLRSVVAARHSLAAVVPLVADLHGTAVERSRGTSVPGRLRRLAAVARLRRAAAARPPAVTRPASSGGPAATARG